MNELRLKIGSVILNVDLLDTPTAKEIFKQAPFNSNARTWGDEVYFSTPVSVNKEPDARDIVKEGELAFWVEGQCIAIGFGPTPISIKDEIRLAEATNIWGKTQDDVTLLKKAHDNDLVIVEKGEDVLFTTI